MNLTSHGQGYMKGEINEVKRTAKQEYISEHIQITIYNKTGYELDSLYFGSQYLGGLGLDSSITFLLSEKLLMQGGVPFGLPQAIPVGIARKKLFLGSCRTGISKLTTGTYGFDISINTQIEGSYYLQWHKHHEK